jgi:hypothetical protein
MTQNLDRATDDDKAVISCSARTGEGFENARHLIYGDVIVG